MGYDADLDVVEKQMNEKFMRKVEGHLGGGSSDLQGAKLLSRVVRWTPDGHLYEADPRHAEQLLRDLR
eukprot:6642477-Alexandrium_andersonii.AAC.1